MQIEFTAGALDDLEAIRIWLSEKSPSGYLNTVRRIRQTLERLLEFPQSGRPTLRPDILELVEPKYGYVIPYMRIEDTIFILRIYPARQQPLDIEELIKP